MSGLAERDLFIFLGRRGTISRWVTEIMDLTADRAAVVVSRQNEIYNQIRNSGPNIVKVDTLNRHVAGELLKRYPKLRDRVEILFHPLLRIASSPLQPAAGRPLRFSFFGRPLQYKGLPLFVEACEILRRENLPFAVSVIGEDNLGCLRKRLEAIGAEIVNRWVGECEISTVMERHDVVVVSSTEASRSGVITVAFAAGRPVIATPV